MLDRITFPQRIMGVLYCLALAYCLTWVPWRAPSRHPNQYMREGYGWVWAGPHWSSSLPKGEGNLLDQIADEYDRPRLDSTPDFPRIVLRFLAVTAIFGAAFFVTSLVRPATPRR
jgi:hypothetical protein